MIKHVLQMKYHPAKKEVSFRRFQNGEEVTIRDDSRLMQYMNMKGKFVLQDRGNAFFDDIAAAFDGLKTVDIQVITTKMDYEDLEQMVEYYNAGHDSFQINITLLAELPDMIQTFTEVKKYGERATNILEEHRQILLSVSTDNVAVRQSAECFANQIEEEINNIQEKTKSLSDNRVNLCFAGAYSTGKSALINALLGCKILPVAVLSETAKMFKIFSSVNKNEIHINFDILGIPTEISLNRKDKRFEFTFGPAENEIRTDIQKKLDDINEQQPIPEDQVSSILSYLNTKEGISSEIIVRFPIKLDTENLQFTIFDTPGTDSNYDTHQVILNEALAVQTHSILIFVAHPMKLEGEGNNALLNYLKDVETKSKTSIDIGRSLFVINCADQIMADQRLALRLSEIKRKGDGAFSIKLADKKLFFTSALYAYSAEAVKNGHASSDEEKLFEAGKMFFSNETMPMSMCFRQNRCATSEIATRNMLEESEAEFRKADAAGDEAQKLIVSSGLFALEREIIRYGEKYASAVRAYAIINSVDKALNKISSEACMLRDSNDREISVIEGNISELRNTINNAITESRNRIDIPQNQDDYLPEEVKKKLYLDSRFIQSSIMSQATKAMDEQLKGMFLLGIVKVKDSDKDKIRQRLNEILSIFTSKYKDGREKLLTEQRDHFMKDIRNAINQNGKISPEAKELFLAIPAPQIRDFSSIHDIGTIYDSHVRTNKILFLFTITQLDKDGFIEAVKDKLANMVEKMEDDFENDYRSSLNQLLNDVQDVFQKNLEDYSLKMKAMIEDRDAMKDLGMKIQDAADDLDECKKSLNSIIWKEIKND